MPIPGIVGAAAVTGLASLLGGNKASKSARESAAVQERLSREALAEQRRIYEEERAREDRDRDEARVREDADRARDEIEQERVMGSRRNAFGGFSGDLRATSQGYGPAYGMTQEQTDSTLARRNNAIPEPTFLPPKRLLGQMPVDGGTMPTGGPVAPGGPMPGPTTPPPAPPGGPSGGAAGPPGGPPQASPNSMAPTVWLRAPTGEEMEVPIEEATAFIAQGAQLIPGPTGVRQ